MIKQFDTESLARDENGHDHRFPSSNRRAEDIDRYVGARVRARRIMLGLSQQQLAESIGITVQQACKYERGANRVSSGRLYQIAQALDVDVGYFVDGMGEPLETKQQHLLRGLARDFMAIPNRKHQEELVSLARALAEPDAEPVAVGASRRHVVWPG